MTEFKPVRFGKYLLLNKITEGGMAELFRAKVSGEEGFEKIIAVKKILPSLIAKHKLIKSFIEEARLAAFLQHENIIRTFDFGRMGQDYFIAMEYLAGTTLRVLIENSIKNSLPIGLENILYIISCICNGLNYAHTLKNFHGQSLNIIHKDISPPNIFITYKGELKIIDFGIAQSSSMNEEEPSKLIKGKVAYMSPEQANGDIIDHRSDIFSIGVILYEMVTGERLFKGDTMEIFSRIRKGEIPISKNLSDDVPASLFEIILKSLAVKPKDRYQSCGQMLSEVEACIHDLQLRPTAWTFSRYIKTMFDQEIKQEEKAMFELMRLSLEHTAEDLDQTIILSNDTYLKPSLKKKICIIGPLATGKTCIVQRYVENRFHEKYNFTVGTTINKKTISFEGRKVHLDLWDLGGEDPISEMNQDFIKGMEGYILVADCTRLSSLSMSVAIKNRLELTVGKIPFICLLNKNDLSKKNKIFKETVDELISAGWTFMKTSAKTGLGINKAFMVLVEKMI
jgi:small GTP-binding protein